MYEQLKSLVIGVSLLILFPLLASASTINGIATFKDLGSELYYGALILDKKSASSEEILKLEQSTVMEIKIVSPISKRRWYSLWTQSVAINSSSEVFSANAAAFSRLLSSFKGGLKRGDVVRYRFAPGKGMGVEINGVSLEDVFSERLFSLCLQSWLGPVPPSTLFRRDLLSESPAADLLDRYQMINPSQQRSAVTSRWLASPDNDESVEPLAANVSGNEARESKPAEADSKLSTGVSAQPDNRAQPEVGMPEELVSHDEADNSLQDGSTQVSLNRAAMDAHGAGGVARESGSAKPSGAGSSVIDSAEDVGFAAEDTRVEKLRIVTETREFDDEPEVLLAADTLIAQQRYISDVRRAVYRNIRYPLSAMRRKAEGQLRVSMVLRSGGELESVSVLEPSEFDAFNDEILRAIQSASPFEPFPAGMADEKFVIDTPFVFKLGR